MGMFDLDFTKKYHSKKDLKSKPRREHWTMETPDWLKAGYDENGLRFSRRRRRNESNRI